MATFKICTMCTSRYQKPLSLKRRKCPTCGAHGRFAFRPATAAEQEAFNAKCAKQEALIQELLSQDDTALAEAS